MNDPVAERPGALLQVRNVSKVYGSGHTAVTALDDATMAVEQGEFVALLGPCLLYTSPSPRDRQKSRMPSSA